MNESVIPVSSGITRLRADKWRFAAEEDGPADDDDLLMENS